MKKIVFTQMVWMFMVHTIISYIPSFSTYHHFLHTIIFIPLCLFAKLIDCQLSCQDIWRLLSFIIFDCDVHLLILPHFCRWLPNRKRFVVLAIRKMLMQGGNAVSAVQILYDSQRKLWRRTSSVKYHWQHLTKNLLETRHQHVYSTEVAHL